MARERRIVEKEVRSVGTKRGFGSSLVWMLTALLLAVAAGALTGVLASYYLNNSRYSVEVSALATYRPPQVTTIYADDGETVLAEFAIEKRIPIKEQDIPKTVENALLAVEDYRYYSHPGIDPYRIPARPGRFQRYRKGRPDSAQRRASARNAASPLSFQAST